MNRALANPLITTILVVAAALITSIIVMAITRPPDFSDDSEVGVRIDQAKLRADVAVSSERLAKGLMGADRLSDDRGMLFVYRKPTTPRIWMKDVRFPVDIVWISGDTVTQVTADVPPAKPGVAAEDLPLYSPDGPVDKVLETAGGWAGRHSVQPGDPVRFSR